MHIHAQRKVDHDREVDLIVKWIGSQSQYHNFYHDVDHNLDYNFDHNFDYDFDPNLDHKYGLIVDLIENYHGFHGPRVDQSRITMVFVVQEWIYRELPWLSWSKNGSDRELQWFSWSQNGSIENYHGFHGPRVDLARITMVFMVPRWI